jgi:hypothetical protein
LLVIPGGSGTDQGADGPKNSSSMTSEPYVGFGTKAAANFMRLFPVSWLL